MEEIWKDVAGFEKYFRVSNKGRIFSKRSSKVLKLTKMKSGYMIFSTKIGGRCGNNYAFRVHRLVAEAFLEPPSKELIEYCQKEHHGKVIVRHIDNNKENNHYTNLIYGTCQDNSNDYVLSGVSALVMKDRSGVDNPNSKFSLEDVDFIRSNYVARDSVFGVRALASRFGVSHSTISKVVNSVRYI